MEKQEHLSLEKERKLNETRRLIDGLCEIMEPSNITTWMKKPNDWFAGKTPLQAIKNGKVDKVWELIFHTKEGGFL